MRKAAARSAASEAAVSMKCRVVPTVGPRRASSHCCVWVAPSEAGTPDFSSEEFGDEMLERSHEDVPSRVGRKQVQNAGDRERLVRFVRGRGRVADQQLYIWAPANCALGGSEFLRIDGDAEHRSCRATERKQVGQVHMPTTEVEDRAAVGCTNSGCQKVVRKKGAWTNRRAPKWSVIRGEGPVRS